jgi:hypothetical protein
MAVCMYDEHARADRGAAHAAYMADPGFAALEAEAAWRGYRKATLSEINASAESISGAVDLYCWRGGLWAATRKPA